MFILTGSTGLLGALVAGRLLRAGSTVLTIDRKDARQEQGARARAAIRSALVGDGCDECTAVGRLPPGSEVMLRFGGVRALALGFYDLLAARTDLSPFLRWSVHPRAFACLAIVTLWSLGLMPARLLLIGVVDLGCAAWTWIALRERIDPSTARPG